ncbi:hypothetical protein SAMN04488540_11418 [Ferrimonas sediminum]|uniref:Cobalt transporter n=1 Tax=Ferrimonas sediminum TaxID=718193 RepID=A0A1G8WY53_9GAMM|nr:hypothetical protein [Ferrimonas sediminum]SDJ82480.1 hypothetical protein SAMN04488540_11418 [Ferrimonas sediminum]
MKRLVLLIVLTLLSQTANAVLEGRHVHLGDTIEFHFDTASHEHNSDDHQHADGETCLHHHCHAGHLGITVGALALSPAVQSEQFCYLSRYPDPTLSNLLRPPIA